MAQQDATTTEDTDVYTAATEALWSPTMNHPKNYFGAVIATVDAGETDALIEEHVVGMASAARRGARALGLLDEYGATERGQRFVEFALSEFDTTGEVLDQFASWKGARGCFAETDPEWADAMADAVAGHAPADAIEALLTDLGGEATLPELAAHAVDVAPDFAAAWLFRADVDPVTADLTDPKSYRNATHFQFKTLLWHLGLVTASGADASRLAPETDVWALPGVEGFPCEFCAKVLDSEMARRGHLRWCEARPAD